MPRKPLKFVFFTDLHAHLYKECSRVVGEGIYDRIYDYLNVLDQIRNFCVENKVKMVIFGGDLFHERGNLNVIAQNLVYEKLKEIRKVIKLFVFNPGQHDFALKTSFSCYTAYRDTIGVVYDEPGSFKANGYTICCHPYTTDRESLLDFLKTPGDIFVLHQGVSEVSVSSKSRYKADTILSIKDLPSKSIINLLGDYHVFQKINKNSWYGGSCLQNNWGDENDEKFFLYVTVLGNSVDVQAIPVEGPKFIQVDYDSKRYRRGVLKGNFVRVILRQDSLEDIEEVRDMSLKMGARSVQIITQPPEVLIEDPDRLTGAISMTDYDLVKVVEQYIGDLDLRGTELRRGYLSRIVRRIMEQKEVLPSEG